MDVIVGLIGAGAALLVVYYVYILMKGADKQ